MKACLVLAIATTALAALTSAANFGGENHDASRRLTKRAFPKALLLKGGGGTSGGLPPPPRPPPMFPPLITTSMADPLSILGVAVTAIGVAMAMSYMAASNRRRSSNYGYARSDDYVLNGHNTGLGFVPAYLESASETYESGK